MSFAVTEYCDVSERARALGINEPTGLALLPRNFVDANGASDLLHESSVQTVRSLFRQNRINETRIEKDGQKIPTIQENEFSLILPTLFVGGLILTGNPHLLSIALNVISNYATDFFKGITGRKKVELDVIVQNKNGKGSKKIHYEGGPEGLKEITEIAGKVFRDEKHD
ncbi:MAG: hypothetical protein ABSC89_07715 [Verrucomicrobiota bacterium]|jgi:hypothetical protein